jgi:hypothetical protein
MRFVVWQRFELSGTVGLRVGLETPIIKQKINLLQSQEPKGNFSTVLGVQTGICCAVVIKKDDAAAFEAEFFETKPKDKPRTAKKIKPYTNLLE